MKTKMLALVMLTVTSLFGAETIPTVPVGILQATPKVVQSGTYPTLSWAVAYPSVVSSVANISSTGRIELLQDSFVSLTPIGADIMKLPVDVRLSVNHGEQIQIFYGDQESIDPTHPTYIKSLAKGSTIDLGARYFDGTAWSAFQTTASSNLHTRVLTNGAVLPMYSSEKVKPWMAPYIRVGKVKVGPKQALLVVELKDGATSLSADFQDAVFLITFSAQHPNNGHGNNVDGVDSSNPSVGRGGPNGVVEPVGAIDDEIK